MRQLQVDARRLDGNCGEFLQTLGSGDLAVFELQSLRLDQAKQLFDAPALAIHLDNAPSLGRVGDLMGGQQPPVQRLHAVRCVGLAHIDRAQPH